MSPAIDPGTRLRLAGSFAGAAQVYAAHRPAYPAEAIRWLAGSACCDVLDVGAGSGSLTAGLAGLGHRVVAVEPSRSMLETSQWRALEVPAVQSNAEALPFAPGVFDVVTVATAFHWFDATRALPQIAAVLRPRGRLATVWNSRLEPAGWPRVLGHLLRASQPRGLRGDWGADSVVQVTASPYFGRLESAEFPFTHRLDRDGLVGMAASRSYVAALTVRRRRSLLGEVGRLFDETASPGSAVELPYLARCWRFSRS